MFDIVRLDKVHKTVTKYAHADKCLDEYMADFGVKTRATAKLNLFDLFSRDAIYWQNAKIAYCLKTQAPADWDVITVE